MSGELKKYVEWRSRGRKTDRVAYVMSQRQLPEPKVGAEWQVDNAFNAAEELLRDPALKDVFKSAIDNGSALVVQGN
jgi:hypothetical protein